MAAGSSYPCEIRDNTGKVIWGGTILFTDDTNQPLGVVLPAFVDGTNLPSSDPGSGGLWWDNGPIFRGGD